MKGKLKLENNIWYVFYQIAEPEQPRYLKEAKLLNQNQGGLEEGKEVFFKITYEQEAKAILL